MQTDTPQQKCAQLLNVEMISPLSIRSFEIHVADPINEMSNPLPTNRSRDLRANSLVLAARARVT